MASHELASVALDDKYTATEGRIYLSGIQALVRLMLVQKWRDQQAGLNTAGFVSGYRGSPLGGLDEALWKAQPQLEANAVKFLPGVNEELAATAVWGTQQVHLTGESAVDGVFAMWYGKAPGVDRCGDVFKHMSHAGTSPHGGILLVAGDDHGASSSTLPNQSDHLFAASMIPMLYPQSVEEYIELGLHGFAMSRFAGLPVGFKALADTVESSGSIAAGALDVHTRLPADFVFPPGGVHARLSTDTLGVQARKQEALMQDYKIYAAIAYARANRLNRVTIDSPKARLGIVASGKSYRDVLEALEELGIDADEAARIGIRLFKVSMPWPLEPDSIREFAQGLEEILVVEEKRQIVEYQLKEHLYNWRENVRPRVIGKFNEEGEWGAHPRGQWLLPATADFSVAQIARVIAGRVARFHTSDRIRMRLAILDAKDVVLGKAGATPSRPAWYCSGCPHNTSTKVPEGSLALAGIGCHVMATAMDRSTLGYTQMGAEGMSWVGEAPFSRRPTCSRTSATAPTSTRAARDPRGRGRAHQHHLQDPVQRRGRHDGRPAPRRPARRADAIAHQVRAEGVKRIVIVSDEPDKYAAARALARGRDACTTATTSTRCSASCARSEGTTALIYDQTCAAEKRRRRKRGTFPDPAKRAGDQRPGVRGLRRLRREVQLRLGAAAGDRVGPQAQIDQSSCNKDYSCVKGFCPSFVTVLGGACASPSRWPTPRCFRPLPEPVLPRSTAMSTASCDRHGRHGRGDHRCHPRHGGAPRRPGCGVLDMAGLAQKGGSVWSHLRFGKLRARRSRRIRIAAGGADLVLGCDMIVAGNSKTLARPGAGRTRVLVNTKEHAGQFSRHARHAVSTATACAAT
jgi:indolepyruvate ferredoxin oxidoreductase